MKLRAAVGTGFGLLLAACTTLVPPSEGTIPVVIENADDEPATVEVTFFRAIEGEEMSLRDPFELAPGDSTRIDVEPTFDENGATHVTINGFVAVTSEFMCDRADVGQGAADLPRSVRVVVLADGTPAVCPFVEV